MDVDTSYTATLTVGESDSVGVVIDDATLSDRDLLEMLWEIFQQTRGMKAYVCPLCNARLSSVALAWSHYALLHNPNPPAERVYY